MKEKGIKVDEPWFSMARGGLFFLEVYFGIVGEVCAAKRSSDGSD